MAKYHGSNIIGGVTAENLSATFKTILHVANDGTTARRIKVYDIIVGCDGTPADGAVTWDMSRSTANGTGGDTITALPLDPADAAALSDVIGNCTGEGTITASSTLWTVAGNSRATYRWSAAPGSELVAPATTSAGFALRAKATGYSSTSVVSVYFEEQ